MRISLPGGELARLAEEVEDMSNDAVAELRATHRRWAWAANPPTSRPYALTEILDRNFFPANRRGLNDD